MDLPNGTLDSMRGVGDGASSRQQRNMEDPQLSILGKGRSYFGAKLLSDPFLVKGVQKVYRYDGIVPGDTSQPPVIPRDPRKAIARIRPRMEVELAIPR